MESLNVLVIEDSKRHQEAAVEQLEARGHKVTVASSLIEAEILLEGIDLEELPSCWLDAFGDEYVKEDIRRWQVPEFRERYPLAAFDVVLTDMNLPASKGLTGVHPKVLKEGLVPLGFIFALRAAARGARYVAMVTDTNHHNSAMSAALDAFAGPDGDESHTFNIDGARVMFRHAPTVKSGEGWVKDWGHVLGDLVAD